LAGALVLEEVVAALPQRVPEQDPALEPVRGIVGPGRPYAPRLGGRRGADGLNGRPGAGEGGVLGGQNSVRVKTGDLAAQLEEVSGDPCEVAHGSLPCAGGTEPSSSSGA